MVDEHLKEKKLRDLQFDQIEREVDKRIDKMKSVLEHKEATIDELRFVTSNTLETKKSLTKSMEAFQNMRKSEIKDLVCCKAKLGFQNYEGNILSEYIGTSTC